MMGESLVVYFELIEATGKDNREMSQGTIARVRAVPCFPFPPG
jgi:hypothetical protein